MSKPSERRGECCCPPVTLGPCDRRLTEVPEDVLDESPAPRQDLTPVPGVGRIERMALVQYPEDAFGHHIAEFLHARPVRITERFIRALLDSTSHSKRLDAFPRVQHVEPVFVVYLREKGPVAAGMNSHGPPATEGILASPPHSGGGNNNRVFVKPRGLHTRGRFGSQ